MAHQGFNCNLKEAKVRNLRRRKLDDLEICSQRRLANMSKKVKARSVEISIYERQEAPFMMLTEQADKW